MNDTRKLSPAELANCIGEIHRIQASFSDAQIAAWLHFKQPYVSKLRHIAKHLKPRLFQAWLDSQPKINYRDIYRISSLSKHEQTRAFRSLLKRLRIRKMGRNAWIVTSKTRAYRFGYTIGEMVRLQILSEPKDRWYLRFMFEPLNSEIGSAPRIKRKTAWRIRRSIVNRIQQGYEAGRRE